MNGDKKKRITVKFLSPNPLFEEWLTRWRDEAAEKDSKMQYCFSTALQSLKKYPLPFESGKDCKILKGFGDKLCRMLDDKLKEYKNEPSHISTSENPLSSPEKNFIRNKLNTDKSRTYVPQYRSGAYAILITLYIKSQELNYKGYLTKSEIIEYGKNLCDTSFTKPEPGSFYTAWSSMQQLLAKKLVSKYSNPAKFSLTDSGIALATMLHEKSSLQDLRQDHELLFTDMLGSIKASNIQDEVILVEKNDVDTIPSTAYSIGQKKDTRIFKTTSENFVSFSQQRNETVELKSKMLLSKFASDSASSTVGKKSVTKYKSLEIVNSQTSASSNSECFIMVPDSFDIILYVDNCETSSRNLEEIQFGLTSHNIKFEVKDLKVGDYAWVCRDRKKNERELILPYIIERKRMDDLASSIRDGRYYEQKFRLKRSGIENLTYLVESYGKNCNLGLPLTSLQQAATNTALQDNFFVQFSTSIKESTQYLVNMSKTLIRLYKSKTLISCPKENLKPVDLDDDLVSLMEFKEFNKNSIKNKRVKVTELFVKMLIQIKGLSVDRALAIVEKYPTVSSLHKAYKEVPDNEKERLLCDIKYGKYGKTIGPVLSKIIHQFFNYERY